MRRSTKIILGVVLVGLVGVLFIPRGGGDGDASAATAPVGSPAGVVTAKPEDPTAASVPAPEVTVTETVSVPKRVAVPKPGPTVYVPKPGPTVYVPKPGPTIWRTRDVPVRQPRATVTAQPDPAATVTVTAQPEPRATVTVTVEPPEIPSQVPTGTPETPPVEDAPEVPDTPEDPGAAPEPPASEAAVFTVASYNVLGHNHTEPGGTRAGWPSSRQRIQTSLSLLDRYRVDVVGLQELQDPQWRAFQGAGGPSALGDRRDQGSAWRTFPGPGDMRHTDNTVAWRRNTFRPVAERTISIPYFDGKPVRMPYVLLEHRATGQRVWVASFHNPASLPWLGSQARYRAVATNRQARLAAHLDDRHPVIFTGDMNARRDYYCPLVRGTGMVASNGGRVAGGRCVLPPRPGIDWIFGTRRQVGFSGHQAVENRASDHPLVVARARVDDG